MKPLSSLDHVDSELAALLAIMLACACVHLPLGLVPHHHAGAAALLSRYSRVRTLVATGTSEDRLLYQARLDEALDVRALRKHLGSHSPEQPTLLDLEGAQPEDWRRVVTALSPFMKAKRVIRLQEALRRRRSRLHVVLENVADPHNSAAVLRSAEACGIQHVHVVESVCEFQLPAAAARSASAGNIGHDHEDGASRWLTLHKYRSTRECAEALARQGLQVFASDCPTADPEAEEAGGGHEHEPADPLARKALAKARIVGEGNGWNQAKRTAVSALPIDDLDFGASTAGTALVFGNERRGVSRLMLERSCRSFYLPMSGLTQSFNISVAVVMSLYSAIASGAFPEGDLSRDEQEELLGRWLLRDVKAARSLLMDAGIEFVDF